MDATQSVNVDGDGEGAQTSAGLNSVNCAGLETGNSGVPPRAEENPDVRLPTLNIERLDPAMIEGLNALSDEDVFEEARGEINLPEDLAANSAEAAKSKEGENKPKKSALDTYTTVKIGSDQLPRNNRRQHRAGCKAQAPHFGATGSQI